MVHDADHLNLCLIIALSSCDSFLDIVPDDIATIDNAFTMRAQAEKYLFTYLNDLSNLNVDLVPDPDNEGKMQVLPMLGWYAGLQYNITPNVFVSGTYSLSEGGMP